LYRALFVSRVCSRTVLHTHINKDTTDICSHITTVLIIHGRTRIDHFNKVILASTGNELPEDGVTAAPKHV